MTDLASLLKAAQAKGQDAEFREWIKLQPSCLSGRFSEYHDDGQRFSVPCHVRRASQAGTAYKPHFSCIPMLDEEHKLQSNKGEAGCLERFLGGKWTVQEAKEFFDEQRIRYLRLWLES